MQTRDVEAVVIGAGTAGTNAFHVLKSAGADVLLVDRGPLGTTCARVGCMPSKAVLHAAARWCEARSLVADPAGLTLSPHVSWQQSRQIRDEFASEAAQSTRSAAGDRLVMEEARFIAADTLQAGQTRIRARAFVICTGSSPVIPEPLRPLQHRLLTTDNLFDLDVLPARVGVLGMGGLGHMGIKLAKAIGAEVTLFTRSASKAEEGRRQGADHVIVSTDAEQMKAAAGHFDFLLDTIPVQHDLNPYLDVLRFDGVHILVGLIEPIEPAIDAAHLVLKRRVIAGSLIGGIAETQEVLDFCAEHGITCDIEMLDIRQINEAFTRMIAGDVKYRFVIDMATLKA